jgi:dTDP-4-dehydrorhamnose reductase
MTEFLVTGAKGLVGSEVVRLLGAQRRSVVGLTRKDVDLSDQAALLRILTSLAPKKIIHCGAMTAVDKAETQAELAWKTNVDATVTIASFAKASNARLIHVSTDYVFDGFRGSYTEGDPISPLGVYAKTKAVAELAVASLNPNFVIARTAVPYGKPGGSARPDFVQWLRRELSEGRPVRVVRDQISNPTFVPNLSEMLVALAMGDVVGIVHTAGSVSLDRYSFATLVCQVFSLDSSLITPIVTKDLQQVAPRPLNASLNLSKALLLGLEPWSAEKGLVAILEGR